MTAWYHLIETPLGPAFAGGSEEGVHRVDFLFGPRDEAWFIARLEREAGGPSTGDPAAGAEACRQLAAYFAGERLQFDLPLAPRGTPFQQQVWEALRGIPPGSTTTYGDIAARIGHPSASRAVGAAIGRNPIAIVIPCHRVIGTNGRLTGYASGLYRKRWLLNHEARALPLFAPGAAGASR